MSILTLCRRAIAAILIVAAAGAGAVPDGIITVGGDGLANNCTFPTIQQAINEAQRRGGSQEIWITRNSRPGVYDGIYDNLNLQVNLSGHNIRIVGGFDDCFDTTPGERTILSATGGPRDPVLRVRGNGSLTLASLYVLHGDPDGDEGGGIDYDARGTFRMEFVAVEYNTATQGGGLRIESNGGAAFVEFAGINSVSRNGARQAGGGVWVQSGDANWPVTVQFFNQIHVGHNEVTGSVGTLGTGGGIHAVGNVQMFMVGNDIGVYENYAERGGGMYLGNGVRMNLAATPFAGFPAVFFNNSAVGGGAIALDVLPRGNISNNPDIEVAMYSPDPSRPLSFRNNRADATGGALQVFVNTLVDNADATICATNIHLLDNGASQGSAVFAQSPGSKVLFNSGDCTFPAGALLPCPAGADCNRIEGNDTPINGSGVYNGAVVQLTQGASAELNRLVFFDNLARAVVSTLGGTAGRVDIANSVFHANAVDGGVIELAERTTGVAPNRITDTTIVENTHGFGQYTIHGEPAVALDLRNTIVHEAVPLFDVVTGSSEAATVVRVLNASGADTAPIGSDIIVATPVYQQTARQRFVLSPTSQGVDAALAGGGVDYDGNPRDIDIPGVNHGGVRDLGAFETQAGGFQDPLFENDFEGPTR